MRCRRIEATVLEIANGNNVSSEAVANSPFVMYKGFMEARL